MGKENFLKTRIAVLGRDDRVAEHPVCTKKTFARAIPISLERRVGGGGQPKATGRRRRRRSAIRRIAIALRRLQHNGSSSSSSI